MKKAVLAIGGLLVGLGVLGHFFAKPLLAQVRAALIQNVDEPGRNPYQERQYYSFTGFCGLNVCPVNFSPVPAGSRLVITDISGSLKLQGTVSVDEIFLTESAGSGAIRVNVPTQYEGFANGITFRQFNSQVHLYVEPGKIPSVEVVLTGNPGAYVQNISLAGYYIKLP